jgi:hypothetical protein
MERNTWNTGRDALPLLMLNRKVSLLRVFSLMVLLSLVILVYPNRIYARAINGCIYFSAYEGSETANYAFYKYSFPDATTEIVSQAKYGPYYNAFLSSDGSKLFGDGGLDGDFIFYSIPLNEPASPPPFTILDKRDFSEFDPYGVTAAIVYDEYENTLYLPTGRFDDVNETQYLLTNVRIRLGTGTSSIDYVYEGNQVIGYDDTYIYLRRPYKGGMVIYRTKKADPTFLEECANMYTGKLVDFSYLFYSQNNSILLLQYGTHYTTVYHIDLDSGRQVSLDTVKPLLNLDGTYSADICISKTGDYAVFYKTSVGVNKAFYLDAFLVNLNSLGVIPIGKLKPISGSQPGFLELNGVFINP